jgi:molybdopterin converting factor small subunit
MRVKVIIHGMFQDATGGVTMIELEDCKTVGVCLQELSKQYPPLGKMLFDQGEKIAAFLNIFVNGEIVNRNSDIFNYPLKNGDEVYPIMMIAGG